MRWPTRSRRALALAIAAFACGAAACDRDRSDDPGRAQSDCSALRVDATTWARATTDDEGPDGLTERQHLADDIVTCKALVGTPATKVIEMLGPPDERTTGELEYLIGRERGEVRLDGEYLELRLGMDKRVTDVGIQ
ncbi:MAG TPA: hypothetical protein VF257_09475 [Solirubrobacteraceae bacterium]